MSGSNREGAEPGGLPATGSGIGPDGRSIPPQTAPNQTSQGESSFSDGSAHLFYMYLKMAEEEDRKKTERWEADADGILIFTGLFSAAVAALGAVSVQDLRPNSQDISAFYLGNIYQVLADPNTSSTIPTPPTLVKPPAFSPPTYAICVNSLWFLSLVVSLTCALLATLLKQWARRYVSITQPPRYSPHKRARIRAFCADGVDTLHLPWAVGALPAMLHLSLFLFFTGLLIYLFNINHTVFNVTAWWVGLSAAVYISITIMPIFRHDSPYYAPLSTLFWSIYHGTAYLALQTRWLIQYRGLRILGNPAATRLFLLKVHYLDHLLGGIRKAVEHSAWKSSEEIDGRVLEWTFDALDEDDELEQFFEGIPGLCASKVLKDPQQALVAKLGLGKISSALMGLLDRTHVSNLASESAKQRQLIICVKAARAMRLPQAIPRILQSIFRQSWNWVLQSVEMGHALKNMSNGTDVEIALFARVIVAGIVAGVRERDSRWFTLALRQLGVPDRVLLAYLSHGNSVLLVNLIHITRHIFCSLPGISRELAYASSIILELLSEFDVQDTLPELQHDFCALWNEIAREARGSGRFTAPVHILRHTRHIYIALHQGTDSAPTAFSAATEVLDDSLYEGSSYPMCNIPGHHRSEPNHHIHEQILVDEEAIPSTAAPSHFSRSPIPFETTADASSTTNPFPLSALSGPIASQQLEGTLTVLPFLTNSPSAPIQLPLRVAEIDAPHE